MTNPKEGGTAVNLNQTLAQSKKEVTEVSEACLQHLFDNLFKLRKQVRFYKRETEYLKSILGIVYEPEKLKLALAKYGEWRDTELQALGKQ